MSYNRKEKRVGALFQERYKSENIIGEKYLYGAGRYIDNNLVKAGIVQRVQDYEWSSVIEYLKEKSILINKNEKKQILNRFNSI